MSTHSQTPGLVQAARLLSREVTNREHHNVDATRQRLGLDRVLATLKNESLQDYDDVLAGMAIARGYDYCDVCHQCRKASAHLLPVSS
jgi:hypothetical protein